MARSFKNSISENYIKAPGIASTPEFEATPSFPGPATSDKMISIPIEPEALKSSGFNNPDSPNQNTITNGEDLNKRVQQRRMDDSPEKPYFVGLYDIDEALGYYFNNVLKPTVVENNEIVQVPTLYGSPERWSAMTQFGAYRDNKGKLILPLIMYRKTNVAKNENLLFPRVDQLYYVSALKWDAKNRYDNFNFRFNNKKITTDRYALTSLPNYVNISYECIVWTSFVEQMNKLIEKIQFSDFTYWGDPDKFKFRIVLEAFDTAVELNVDTERMVKSTFNVTLYGYILPEDFNSKLTTRVTLSPKKIVFKEVVDVNLQETYVPSRKIKRYDFDTDITSEVDLNS